MVVAVPRHSLVLPGLLCRAGGGLGLPTCAPRYRLPLQPGSFTSRPAGALEPHGRQPAPEGLADACVDAAHDPAALHI